ncbi:MAG: M20/M25/M40 family metallo-hydrolase, partial [Halobacteriota archaeon]
PYLVEAAVEAVSVDGHGETVVKPHATDAGHLDRAGVDCVVVGPAERGEAHSDDESVSVEALERSRRAYRDLLEDGRLGD